MNKSQLIEAIAAGSGLSKKDSEAALKATLDSIEGALAKVDKRVVTLLQTRRSRSPLPLFLHSRLVSLSRTA